MSSLVLQHKTFVAVQALVDKRLLNLPCSNVCPFLLVRLGVLLGVGCLPSGLPVVGELLKERGVDVAGLDLISMVQYVLATIVLLLTTKFILVMFDAAAASCARAIGARAALANRTEFLICML